MIVFTCPKCRAVFQVEDRLAGQTIGCTGCGNLVGIPKKIGIWEKFFSGTKLQVIGKILLLAFLIFAMATSPIILAGVILIVAGIFLVKLLK